MSIIDTLKNIINGGVGGTNELGEVNDGARKHSDYQGYKTPSLDNEFEEKYGKLMTRYSDVLKGNLKQMLLFALEENDVENKKAQYDAIKEAFGLDDNQIADYMLIVEIEKLYTELKAYLELYLEFGSSNENEPEEDLREILENFWQTYARISKMIEEALAKSVKCGFSPNFQEDLELYSELSSNSNFIIYLGNIEGERRNTIETKSGRGVSSMSKICKEITLLNKSNYELLRQNSKIHQIVKKGTNYGITLTSDNIAYERIGSITAKVAYIRIPVLRENLELLKSKYNNNELGYILLIIGFGDFVNCAVNEEKLYSIFETTANNNIFEIERVIKIFKEPFTPETFEIACSIIEGSVDITKSLNDSPLEPLVVSNRLKNGK